MSHEKLKDVFNSVHGNISPVYNSVVFISYHEKTFATMLGNFLIASYFVKITDLGAFKNLQNINNFLSASWKGIER